MIMSMNAAQFKRMTLVLVLPLFLCGVAIYSVLPSSGWTFMLCSTDGSCREMRTVEQENLESDRKQYLEIWTPELDAQADFFMQTFRTEGKIVYTTPLIGFDTNFEAEEKVARQLLGKDAVFFLGGTKDHLSWFDEGSIYLWCKSISFKQDAEVISARCRGDGWQEIVHFTPASDQASFFTELYANIKAASRAKWAIYVAIQSATLISFLLMIYGPLYAVIAAAIFGYRYVRYGTFRKNLPR